MAQSVDDALCEARLRLRDARREKGLTQKQVEQRCGIKQPLLSAYESGQRELSAGDILRLCELYEKPPSYIFGEKAAVSREGTPPDPAGLDDALFLMRSLCSQLRDSERVLCENFIRLCIYKTLRTLYCANPRHKSTKLFNVSEQQLDSALTRSLNDLKTLLGAGLSVHPAQAGRIELPPEYSAALRAFVKTAEETVSFVPEDTDIL